MSQQDNYESGKGCLGVMAGIAIIGVLAVSSVFNTVQADGFFVEGQINQNMDTATDYTRWKDGSAVPIEGIATLSAGYAIKPADNTKVAFGISHYSNPWTGEDYGGNGLFIKGCVGNGC